MSAEGEIKEIVSEQPSAAVDNPDSAIGKKTSQVVATKQKPNIFEKIFYMKHFRVTDIILKVVGRTVIIDASHNEHVDEHGFVSRYFVHRMDLEEDVIVDKLVSYITADGVLTILAPRGKAATMQTGVTPEKLKSA